MSKNVILIGPIGAGKTTVGRLLAQRLDRPLCSLDDGRGYYYGRVGYDQARAKELAASGEGFRAMLRYAEPFDAQMVELVLADYPEAVIDFGASNSVYDDEEGLDRVERALAPIPDVILLLPSADADESAEYLKQRLVRMLTAAGKGYSAELFELNRYFIEHVSNRRLAKRIVYTMGKTAEAVCAEILTGDDILGAAAGGFDFLNQ